MILLLFHHVDEKSVDPLRYEPVHEVSNNLVLGTTKGSDQPAHTLSLITLEYSMSVMLLTEHNLEFLRLIGGCRGLSESILVEMPHCWKSHATAHMFTVFYLFLRFHRNQPVIVECRDTGKFSGVITAVGTQEVFIVL